MPETVQSPNPIPRASHMKQFLPIQKGHLPIPILKVALCPYQLPMQYNTAYTEHSRFSMDQVTATYFVVLLRISTSKTGGKDSNGIAVTKGHRPIPEATGTPQSGQRVCAVGSGAMHNDSVGAGSGVVSEDRMWTSAEFS